MYIYTQQKCKIFISSRKILEYFVNSPISRRSNRSCPLSTPHQTLKGIAAALCLNSLYHLYYFTLHSPLTASLLAIKMVNTVPLKYCPFTLANKRNPLTTPLFSEMTSTSLPQSLFSFFPRSTLSMYLLLSLSPRHFCVRPP